MMATVYVQKFYDRKNVTFLNYQIILNDIKYNKGKLSKAKSLNV